MNEDDKVGVSFLTEGSFILFLLALSGIFYYSFYIIKDNVNELKFIEPLHYLKIRAEAATFYQDNINTVDDLKLNIEKDDKFVEDLIKRKIINKYNEYSDLKNFRESKMDIYKNEPLFWIDYSTNKIENNIYIVNVSEKICDLLNKNTFNKNRICIDNTYKINLNNKFNEKDNIIEK